MTLKLVVPKLESVSLLFREVVWEFMPEAVMLQETGMSISIWSTTSSARAEIENKKLPDIAVRATMPMAVVIYKLRFVCDIIHLPIYAYFNNI